MFSCAWLAETMRWLVLSSLFVGLLAFQNSSARYFFSMGRAAVLPSALDMVNGRGRPRAGAIATSAVSLVLILLFVIFDGDPVNRA